MLRAVLVWIALGALGASVASADPAHVRRVKHAAALGVVTAIYFTGVGFQGDLASARCRWCTPPDFDEDIRKALVWHDPGRAGTLSTLTGYTIAPLVALGWTFARTPGSDDRWLRWFDDDLPILEAVAYGEVIADAVKLSVGRERPFVAFAPKPVSAGSEANLSFFSGHTTLAFTLAVGAGTIAHRRHARLEPVVWGVGLALGVVTGYLRIAADEHYASDVLTGAVFGTLAGYGIPRALGDLPHDAVLVPTPSGVALAGTW